MSLEQRSRHAAASSSSESREWRHANGTTRNAAILANSHSTATTRRATTRRAKGPTAKAQEHRPKERQRMILTTTSPHSLALRSVAPRSAARARRSPTRQCTVGRTGVRPRPVARASFEARRSRQPVASEPSGGVRERYRPGGGIIRPAASPPGAVARFCATPFLFSALAPAFACRQSCPITAPHTSRLARRPRRPTQRLIHDGSSVAPRAASPLSQQLTLDEVRLNEGSIAFASP